MILEAILGKIKLYEKGQDKKWAELIQVRVVFLWNPKYSLTFSRILATSIQMLEEVNMIPTRPALKLK